MGTHGLCARVRVGTLAGGRRGRRVIAPFVVSIGLLPALAGCSSFSSPPSSSDSPSSATVGIAGPVVGRGGVNVDPGSVSGPGDDTGPSGLLANLFRSNSTPSAAPSNMPRPPSTYTASAPPYTPSNQTAAVPPPPGTYPPSTQTAAAPSPPSTYASSASFGIAGPVAGRGAVNIDPGPSGPATEDTGPSGLLANLFRSNSTPSATPSNMPRPPSTYTVSVIKVFETASSAN
jgi:hypothetical protein